MQLQWVDLVVIGIIGLSAFTGLFRGVIKEVIALGVWVVGLWVGYHYTDSLTPWVAQYVQNSTAQTAIAFVIILIGVLIAGSVLNYTLSLLLKSTGLSSIDKLLGMCFGFIRGGFIVSLILAILSMTSLPYQQYVNNSMICNQLRPVVNWISSYIPMVLNQIKSVDTISAGMGNLIDAAPRF
jgi:membrane protein required for colicin V production